MQEHNLNADLDHILDLTRDLWEDMRGSRLFLTGGTGFFGNWLVESFLWANERLHLQARVTLLTRNVEAFQAKSPHLALHPAVDLLHGDIRDFPFPAGEFPFIIHAATEASARMIREEPGRMLSTIVDGNNRALAFAAQASSRRFLLTSSGAVYGRQPSVISHVPEDYAGAPNSCDASSVYGEGKRMAELLCAVAARESSLECLIARCFAFVGPHLPIDSHFAIGNFIRDGLAGGPIRVQGDGTPYRSYLYASDLAVWLWTILFRGVSCRPYNVGSESHLDIAELANRVAAQLDSNITVEVANPRSEPVLAPERYTPSTRMAANELGLQETVGLEEAVRRTARWHQQNSSAIRS